LLRSWPTPLSTSGGDVARDQGEVAVLEHRHVIRCPACRHETEVERGSTIFIIAMKASP
jgi:hypothetical protein